VELRLKQLLLVGQVESRLEGVNRQNLKFTNIKHALHLRLGLETNRVKINTNEHDDLFPEVRVQRT
jgi:hypothetical protein